jgi:Zn-dependent peptidase ImmA (M78 family)
MIKPLNQKLIKNRAEKIVFEHKISSFPINPIIIAREEDIEVQPKNDCIEGISGVLIKAGDQCGIMYSTFYNNPGFENFSISHELGHYFLDDHLDQLIGSSGTHLSKAGFFSSDQYEREADIFAASLLMPEDLFKNNLWKFENGLTGIIGMSDLCNTSLTATAIRYAELSDNFLIVIVSTGGKIDFCCFSQKAWKIKDKVVPKKGWPIPKNTATEALSRDMLRIRNAEKDSMQIDLSDWIECDIPKDVIEEVKGLGRYGKILTVLSL